ncbi:MAG: SDR family oxidoreductase, partial [Planctomycetota bacterium]
MKLNGRTALITGGTQGVGAAIARSLAGAGCDLVLHGLCADDESRATETACREMGVQVTSVFEDLSVPTEVCVPNLLQSTAATGLEPDILVNNAGTFAEPSFLEMDYESFQRTMRLNVQTGFFLTQALAKRWITKGKDGRVVFTGSINGILAEQDHTAYDTSKGAVHSMVRTLCVALAPHGIRVNAIAPGLVVTPLTAPALESSQSRKWMELHTP